MTSSRTRSKHLKYGVAVFGLSAAAALPLPAARKAAAPNAVPGELIVRYRGDSAPFRVLRGGYDVQRVRQRGDVIYAGPNRLYRLLSIPNDPLFPRQWNFRSGRGGARVDDAWRLLRQVGRGAGGGAVVAVIDTGVAFEQFTDTSAPKEYAEAPDFMRTSFAAPRNMLRQDEHAIDEVSHGTHVAGTIAASTNDGIGAAGIAAEATLIPINAASVQAGDVVLPESAIAGGLRWAADHGAQVINMSFGDTRPSEIIADAVTYAREKGCVMVAAAGNDGTRRLMWPAALDAEVMGVTACRFDGRIAGYSNRGRGVALCAPGGDTLKDQNHDGIVDGVFQQTFRWLSDPTHFDAIPLDGTSMACAHVSGAAALVAGCGITDGSRIRGILQGAGHAGYTPEYGWGHLNAADAVRRALYPATSRGRILRVEAIQVLMRQSPNGYVPDVKVRVSDEQFRPVGNVAVEVTYSAHGVVDRDRMLTATDGVASTPGPEIADPAVRSVKVRVLALERKGYRFSRQLSAELEDNGAVPMP